MYHVMAVKQSFREDLALAERSYQFSCRSFDMSYVIRQCPSAVCIG